jgi:hypothetical protein
MVAVFKKLSAPTDKYWKIHARLHCIADIRRAINTLTLNTGICHNIGLFLGRLRDHFTAKSVWSQRVCQVDPIIMRISELDSLASELDSNLKFIGN